jgi:5-methylcytosine-specific restriction endonuclease McrA
MTRSASEQYKFRKAVFKANIQTVDGTPVLVCYICGYHIKPGRGEAWEADHVIALALGGVEGRPCCKACHKHKTATQDVPAIAKSKRSSDRHYGIKRKGGGWPKRTFRREVER